MAIIQKIFAYNTGSLISGTTQVGDIAVSEADVEYSANFGGLQWWGGPDETLGYVIAHSDPSRVPDYLGFWRSDGLSDSDFLNLCNSIPPRIGFTPFTNTNEAYTWLNSNGYWTSFIPVTLTPTPTNNVTPTVTPTISLTPTNTTTVTPTTTPTVTPTISLTPTLTPTPSATPIPVTGYGYNLVVLPYAPPTSGNTIFPRFTVSGETSGVTTPNTFNVNGVFWNAIDNLSVNRISYYSGMTGTSVTAYFTQNGDTAIYSGSSTAFTFEGPPGQQAFNYNPQARPSQLVLIQSASTDFVTGQTVYISYVVN
jgi:hypothetical protein